MPVVFTPDMITPEEHLRKSSRTGAMRAEQILLDDPDTGMMIKTQGYPAGDFTPLHTHSCAHGFYVLKGTLRTSFGDFPPGSFVWIPEGEACTHGATEDEGVYTLFITNKPFDIHYIEDEG